MDCSKDCNQASLSFTLSQRLVKLMSIELVMPSNNLALCHPFLLLLSIFPSIRVFLLGQLESRLLGEISLFLRYADDTTLMAESEEELKSLLKKVKVESEKVGLKLNIQKTKIMASGPITSRQIDGETVADFIFGGSKITADGDCSHEIKRRLLLGMKVMTKPR